MSMDSYDYIMTGNSCENSQRIEKLEPRAVKIDLDYSSFRFDGFRTHKAVIIRYENKEYVAKTSDLIDALVASGLFKVVEE